MLASRLKNLRTKKKITQEELAGYLSIPRGTYAHYELGKREPDNNMLLRIATFFNVSTDYLLGITDDPNKTPYQSPQTTSELREEKSAYDSMTEPMKKIVLKMEDLPIDYQEKILAMINMITGPDEDKIKK